MTEESRKRHVFLSYSREDADMMHRVRDQLNAAGLRVWTDETGLEPGTPSWEAAVQDAIRDAGCMVVLLSPDAMESEWVNREVAFADTLDLHILPVLVRGDERNAVPLRLTSHQRINASRDVDEAMATLITAIIRCLASEPPSTLRPTPAPTRPRRGLPLRAWIGVAVLGVVLSVGAVIGILALPGAFGGGDQTAEESPLSGISGGEALSELLEVPTPAPTPIPLGFELVTRNASWRPVFRDFDGLPMALVPAGCFMMGSDNDVERPIHEVCFHGPFWIDAYEVTNAQYGSEGEFAGDDRPREFVSWFDAVAHCESRSARLPTEAEWEYAVRGPDGLIYPWGNEFVGDHVVYVMNSGSGTVEVGSTPGGVSWVGAYDMSGNVSEWVADWYGPYTSGSQVDPIGPISGESRVLRGGSWAHDSGNLRGNVRFWNVPGNVSAYDGFRCARDYDPADLAP